MHLPSYGEMAELPKDTVILIIQLQWEVGWEAQQPASSPLLQHLLTELSSPSVLVSLDSPWLPGHCAISLPSQPYTCHVFTWMAFVPPSPCSEFLPIFPLQPGDNLHRTAAPGSQVTFPACLLSWHQGSSSPHSHSLSFSYLGVAAS